MKRRLSSLLIVAGVASGCNFQFPDFRICIDLSKTSPIPVDKEVDKILDEWQKRRAGSTSFFAKFKRTFDDHAFKTKRVNDGFLRYRHPDAGRLDIASDAHGKAREVFLWSKENEFRHYITGERRLEINDFSKSFDNPKFNLFEFMRGFYFVWLVPTDKETLQKHGAIRKINEDDSTITLRVDSCESIRQQFLTTTVQLRKSDYLPTKLIVKENAETEVTYEFSEIAENVELGQADFDPPKINEAEWKITRQKFQGKKPSKAPKDDAKK